MEKYQTFGRRFWAGILDSLILLPITGGITIFFHFASPLMITFSSIAVGFVSVSYYILMHNYFGQTLGKMTAKVKVIDISETPINFGQAIVRSLPQIIPVMFSISFSTADSSFNESKTIVASLIYGCTFMFYVADAAVCLFNEKDRALHDFIAGTIVVRTDV